MPAYPTPESVSVANALRGERTRAEVTFPVTGDSALDLASGILAVIRETTGLRPGQVLDVLRYLVARQERADKENQLQAQVWARAQGVAASNMSATEANWRASQLANELSHGQLLRETYTGQMPPIPDVITCRAEDKP